MPRIMSYSPSAFLSSVPSMRRAAKRFGTTRTLQAPVQCDPEDVVLKGVPRGTRLLDSVAMRARPRVSSILPSLDQGAVLGPARQERQAEEPSEPAALLPLERHRSPHDLQDAGRI